jgi:hypothetical protein
MNVHRKVVRVERREERRGADQQWPSAKGENLSLGARLAAAACIQRSAGVAFYIRSVGVAVEHQVTGEAHEGDIAIARSDSQPRSSVDAPSTQEIVVGRAL